jgi:hypothetical protein
MRAPHPATWLQWALALVIGQASVLLLLQARQGALHGGVHATVASVLAGVELGAVILFLIPRTLPLGARLLWVVLAAATLIHLHAGEMPSPVFLVYAAGIWVVLSDGRRGGTA